MEENRRPQIHVTALNMLSFCGEQFRRRYVCGEKVPPGVAMLIGSATDKAVTADLRSKIERKKLLKKGEVESLARDSLVAGWNGGVSLDDEQKSVGVAATKGLAIDAAVRLARLHHKVLAPKIQPKAVQRSFALDIEGCGYQLVGTMDVEDDKGIRDTKTKSRTPARDEADRSIQLTGYALALKAIDGKMPERVTLDFLVDGKEPSAIVQESTRTNEQVEAFLRRLEKAIEAITKGVFLPASPTDFRCSPRWCGYWSSCVMHY